MVRNQTINVHCGCKGGCGSCGKKKRRKAHKRKGVSSNTPVTPNFQPIHAFSPVYIQSGTPAPDPNPLLQAIQEINSKVEKHHTEYLHNELRSRVYNADRGHIAQPRTEERIAINAPSPNQHHLSQPKSLDFEEVNPMLTGNTGRKTPVKRSTRFEDDDTDTPHLDSYHTGIRPSRMRSPIGSPSPRFTERDGVITTSRGEMYESIPTPSSSSSSSSSSAGGGAGETRGTIDNPKCGKCGLRGHKSNTKNKTTGQFVCQHHPSNNQQSDN